MTPLGRRLAARIAAAGPMRVADYMQACLTDPVHGYYATRDPLGAAGDFTTAPEISQMFGEMVALWLAACWQADGRPGRVCLVELGPGRGTLMADILRTARRVPGFADALSVVLVEASPVLRDAQARALAGLAEPDWADGVDAVPADRPLWVVANEFFDALPIRQFERRGGGWAERMVGLADDALAPGLAPAGPDPVLDARFGAVPEGTVVETCAPAEAVVGTLGARIAAQGGGALLIDYGGWDGTGDTLQAVRGHRTAPVFDAPGEADLTAHVGFRWLAGAAAPLRASFTTQGTFLERLGITARAQRLAGLPGGGDIAGQHRRLTHPDEMGTLFKVMALRPADAPEPPGFADG